MKQMSGKFTVSYAQNREDLILGGFFAGHGGKPGFYVDVGAGHPMIDSVTRRFYEAGWRGINIDPINHIHKALQLHRKRDINLNIGISNKAGILRFREYAADGFSTFSEDVQRQYVETPDEYTKNYTDYEVKTRTLADVLAEHKANDIQFLKIDVEGYEYEVIEGNDWNKFRPEVICIEANHIKKDWRKCLGKNHYKLAFFDGLNEYYADEHKQTRLKFSYVDAIINKEPILRYDAADELEKIRALADKYKKDKEFLESHIADLNYRLEQEQAEIDSLNNTGTYIKKRARRALGKIKHNDSQKDSK